MIGVFDSGFGGLTVLDALIRRLPRFDYFYLGDSARAPYGARSPDVIYEFTREAVEFLFDAGCPLVILACNTASARALRTLQQRHLPARRPHHRILGVVRPSAEALAGLPPDAPPDAGARGSSSGTVAVLGTAGTIASDSYRLELAKLAPGLRLVQQACPLWVPLVEEGELAGPAPTISCTSTSIRCWRPARGLTGSCSPARTIRCCCRRSAPWSTIPRSRSSSRGSWSPRGWPSGWCATPR